MDGCGSSSPPPDRCSGSCSTKGFGAPKKARQVRETHHELKSVAKNLFGPAEPTDTNSSKRLNVPIG
jgi:hypothetical protein